MTTTAANQSSSNDSTMLYLPHNSHFDVEILNQSSQPISYVEWSLVGVSNFEIFGNIGPSALKKAAWHFFDPETKALPNFSVGYQIADSTTKTWHFELGSELKSTPLTKLVLTIFPDSVDGMACTVSCYNNEERLASFFCKRETNLGSYRVTPVLTAFNSASGTRESSRGPSRPVTRHSSTSSFQI